MTEDMYDAVVVGGGLAGLSAAHRLVGHKVLLLEKADRFGGRIRSERRGRYWLNWGGHVYNGPGSATGDLLASVGVPSTPVPGNLAGLAMNGKLLTTGRVETYPFRVPMAWSDRLALLRAGAKVRLAGRKYAAVAAPREGEDYWRRQQRIYDFRGDQTFGEYVGSLPDDADALFRPTVSRSAGDPEQVSAGAGIGYFQLVWDKDGGLSRNIIGGPSTFTEAIAAGLGPDALLGAEVDEVVHARDHVVVRYRHGGADHEIKARFAVIATIAPVAHRIAPDLNQDVREALAQVHRHGALHGIRIPAVGEAQDVRLHRHQVEQQAEAAAQPERVPPSRDPVRGHGHGRGDQRVPGVVVGGGGADAERRGGGGHGAGEHAGVLGVEALGEEHRPEAELLGLARLGDHVGRGGRVPRQAVAAQLREALAHRRPSARKKSTRSAMVSATGRGS